MNRRKYEKDLENRQEEHLKIVEQLLDDNWQPCFHDSCSECHGTGVKRDGTMCIHMISCPCPKCTLRC